MRKSEFLRNLATAVTRQEARLEPSIGCDPFVADKEVTRDTMAKGHAIDLAIFVEDRNHLRDIDNPVVRAIVWFSTRESSKSSAVEDLEMAEDAWEYFERKKWGFVNLYLGTHGELTTDDGRESGQTRRFVIEARLIS